jgi:hypothetical protein
MYLMAPPHPAPQWSRSIGTGGRDPSERVVTIVGMRSLHDELRRSRTLHRLRELIGRNEGKMALCGITKPIQRLFEIASLNQLFEIYPTREQAIGKFRRT